MRKVLVEKTQALVERTQMAVGIHRTAVDIYHANGTSQLGFLQQCVPRAELVYQNGSRPSHNPTVESFRIIDKSPVWSRFCAHRNTYAFPPILATEAPYSVMENAEDVYPPSTGSWLKHTGASGERAMYCIYSDVKESQNLLVVTEMLTGKVLFAAKLKPYEVGILELDRDDDLYRRLQRESRKPRMFNPCGVLPGPAPSLDEFRPLLDTAGNVGFSYEGNSFDKTVDSLVPASFPDDVRIQLKAFYAHVVKSTMPSGDPLEFIQSLANFSVLRGLLAGHIRCVVDGVKPPEYVRIMQDAARNRIQSTAVPLPGEIGTGPPWLRGWTRINEEFPSWFHRVSKYVDDLSSQDTVSMTIPVNREQAQKSSEAWADRMAFAIHGFLMRGQVRQNVLGLKYVLYLGSAYRWPHKHTAWSVRFGRRDEKPSHLQVMLMPPRAVSKVKNRVLGAISVDWMASRLNLRLFDAGKKQWKLSARVFTDSVKATVRTKDIRRNLRIREREKVVTLSPLEARVLGLASLGFYLEILEAGTYSSILGITKSRLKDTLNNLVEKRVLTMTYMPAVSLLGNLYHIGVEVKGDEERVNSVLRAFLMHAPSSTVYMDETRTHAIIVARIPARAVADLTGQMPSTAREHGLDLSIRPVSSYVAYTNDLYSRLLLEDGRWDDDVSGLTSQSRSTSPDDEK